MLNTLRSPICTPLVSENMSELIEHAEIILKHNPDLIEWRVDKFNDINKNNIIEALYELNQTIAETPLLFTLRNYDEGGYNKIGMKSKDKILTEAINTGLIDIVDYEMNMINKNNYNIKRICSNNNTKLLLSWHNFEQTPDANTLCNKILEGRRKKADIAKVVVMAKNYNDINALFETINQAKIKKLNIPYILIAMGEKGIVSRVLSGLIGSCFTFAAAYDSSAPGQLYIEDLRSIWNKMQYSSKNAMNTLQLINK